VHRDENAELQKIVERLKIDRIKRHILLCTGDKCCPSEEGMKTWDYLKERTRDSDAIEAGIYRTKVGCLRVCREGPIALVYPEGVWYKRVTVDACKKIFEQHLLGGKVVEELKFAEQPLHPGSDSRDLWETP
jgi:(2Fe-2S) ferredoxin